MTPGSALSGQFMFSSATVCLGPLGSAASLIPVTHSIGLTKNVNITANPTTVDLTQGIRQDIVMSVVNKMEVTASFEVYEYTAKNLAYGLGMDGSGYTLSPVSVPVGASVSAAATSITVASNVASQFTAGTWGYIQENLDDQVHLFKVTSSVYTSPNTTITLDAGYAVPTGMNFTTGARVGSINKIDANPNLANNSFSAKIIGTSIKDQRPLMIVFPKVRITRGFGINFTDSNFGNMPFELTPLAPLPTDTGYSTDFREIMTVLTP